MDLAARRSIIRPILHRRVHWFGACHSYMLGAWQTKAAVELGIGCSWPQNSHTRSKLTLLLSRVHTEELPTYYVLARSSPWIQSRPCLAPSNYVSARTTVSTDLERYWARANFWEIWFMRISFVWEATKFAGIYLHPFSTSTEVYGTLSVNHRNVWFFKSPRLAKEVRLNWGEFFGVKVLNLKKQKYLW